MTLNFEIEADVLAQTTDCLRAIGHEAKLHISDDGLRSALVDAANVALCDVHLPNSAFESLEVDAADGGEGGSEKTIGINLDRLDEVLSLADSDETVRGVLNDETRTIDMATGGLSFSLGLIAPDNVRQEPDLPELEWPAEIAIRASGLTRACKATDLVAERLTLSGDPDAREFVISADGDTDTVRLTFDDDDDVLVDASVDESCASIFGLEYMQRITRPLDSDSVVTVRWGSELPVHMRSRAGPATVRYVLAPRIET